MPDISEFCPHCGRPVREGNVFPPDPIRSAPVTAPESSKPPVAPQQDAPFPFQPPVPWNDRIPGALAYLTFIPALTFLFLESYQKRKFVRFHAAQSLLFWVGVLLFAVIGVLASMFGWLFLWLLSGSLIGLALFFTWLLLSIKALQGQWFSLPLLGAFAAQLGSPGSRPFFGR